MIIDFPGTLPHAVARAMADDRIPSDLRDALRVLAGTDEGRRLDALDVIREAVGIDTDSTAPRGLRLFPALVALSSQRVDAEQAVLVGSACSLELMRLAIDGDIPEGLEAIWDETRLVALKLCAQLLSEPVEADLLGPLLASLAALQGDGELASLIASADELIDELNDDSALEDEDEDDDEDEDEDEDEDDNK